MGGNNLDFVITRNTQECAVSDVSVETLLTDHHVIQCDLVKVKPWSNLSVTASRLWNDLPIYICIADSLELFMSQLKTHLFKTAFEVYL